MVINGLPPPGPPVRAVSSWLLRNSIVYRRIGSIDDRLLENRTPVLRMT